MRFCSSVSGSFALAFTSAPGKVTHVVIRTTQNGFSVKEATQNQAFHNLQEILEYYKSYLLKPFDSTLPFEPFFFGDLSTEQATEYLTGKKPGTFLIRFSRLDDFMFTFSKPGFLAGSYVDSYGNVAKCLISSSPSFRLVDCEGMQHREYPTIKELVKVGISYSYVLTYTGFPQYFQIPL